MKNELPQITVRDCYFTADVELQERSSSEASSAPFRMVARSAKPINHHIWGAVVHDMSGINHKNRIPIDFNHDPTEVVGYANHFNVNEEGLEIRGALTPFKDSDRATEILHKSEQGVPWEASINFAGDMEVERIEENETVQVNGHEFSGPLTVIRSWHLRGVAVTPYGYDSSTVAEFSDSNSPIKVKEVTMSDDAKTALAETEDVVESQDVENSSEAVAVEETATAVEEQPQAEKVELTVAVPAQKYFDAFGEQQGSWYFAHEVPFDVALAKEMKRLREENKDLRSKVDTQATSGHSDAVAFSAGEVKEPEKNHDREGKLINIPINLN